MTIFLNVIAIFDILIFFDMHAFPYLYKHDIKPIEIM